MQSVISYKERGKYGNSNYRGNCSGYVIKDLIDLRCVITLIFIKSHTTP